MEKHKKREITVEKAAEMLSVTPRSVINYIKSKDIEAVKVGKNWFIAKASIDAFSRKHGFNKTLKRKFPQIFRKKFQKTRLLIHLLLNLGETPTV
jgi:excisionase family DNA binding protein